MSGTTPHTLTVLISGASGLIGRALSAELRERGHSVHTLVRRMPSSSEEHHWDPAAGVIDSDALEGVDVVVNLSGASIGKIPWTPAYKKEILNSRVSATATLVQAINDARTPPTALVQASAVGFYGDRGDQPVDEETSAGTGFLADVVLAWEKEAVKASPGVRVALARTGLVVATSGAMAPLKLQTLLGVAGPVGGGAQWWPWVSLRDEVRALVHLIESSDSSGVYNLVGPEPARSLEVTKTLARLMKRPHWLGLPRFAVSTLMGEAGRELLLTSQRVAPTRLLAEGFEFLDHTVDSALRQIV